MLNSQPPIILIGMHRSGTSLVAETLHKCGIFMGADANSHCESAFFLDVNERVYRFAHAYWDRPMPVKTLCADSEQVAGVATRVGTDYLDKGMKGYWKKGLLASKPSGYTRWGWKDPRNSFTLPMWLKHYPDARIVHIYRHPLDVAMSLNTRERKRLQKKLMKQNSLSKGSSLALRCLSLDESLCLWDEYATRCLELTEELPQERVFSLCYEDFLAEPLSHLESVLRFCETKIAYSQSENAIVGINASRAYAFRTHPDTNQLLSRCQNLSAYHSLGYSHRDEGV